MSSPDHVPFVQRRRLLQATGAFAAAGLAGCLGGQPDSPGDTPDGSPTDGPTSTPGSVTTNFTVTATRCGNQVNQADVSFDDETVVVEGTTWGNNACFTGRLESVTFEDGTLTVRVVAENAADADQGCAQCISEIDYEASVEVPSTPGKVVVVHRGETVATVSP